jgi:hypothetical protein
VKVLIQREKQQAFSKKKTSSGIGANVNMESQTDPSITTEKELDLLVEQYKMERKFKKQLKTIQKQKGQKENKISKFIYFFFTL